jgi:hypothetical protein
LMRRRLKMAHFLNLPTFSERSTPAPCLVQISCILQHAECPVSGSARRPLEDRNWRVAAFS